VSSELKVDNISEKTTNAGVQLGSSLGFVSKTTTEMNALTGMAAGDTIYNSTVGTLYVYNGTSWNAMSASTFTFSVDYLVIAGGGGGGSAFSGGGGGAGGYRNSYSTESSGGGASSETSLILASGGTAYTVTVGAGGTGATSSISTVSTAGADSVFSTVTSLGGSRG